METLDFPFQVAGSAQPTVSCCGNIRRGPNLLGSSGDSGGWPGVARATPESSLATPVATQDLIGSWSSSSTQEIREMLSINDDS